METSSRFRVAAPLDQAWAAFRRPDRLAACFPGATVDASGDDQFSGGLTVKVGTVSLHYRGTATYLERDDDRHRLVVQASGEDVRGSGTVVAVVTTALADRGPQTEVTVTTQLELTGRPSRYADGVLAEVSSKLFDQFAGGLASQFADGTFAGRAAVEPGVAPVPPPVVPTAPGRPAGGTSGGAGASDGGSSSVLERVPPRVRRLALPLVGAAGLLALVAVLVRGRQQPRD